MPKTMNVEAEGYDLIQKLESLFSENYSKLYACAYRMLGNHQDAEDALQSAFLKAYKNIDNFKGESELYTWVYRIVINESNRSYEITKKLPVVRIAGDLGMSEREFFASIAYVPDLEDDLIMDEMREKCLHAFLKCLPQNQRVCFLLKTCMHLKNQEIADILEMSVENVKVTLFRGRKKLQELFEMRCSLIDPNKPCECHLWIKFMRDRHLPLPEGYRQPKVEELKKEHFKNMTLLRKIDYLYTVEASISKEEFMKKLKKASEVL